MIKFTVNEIVSEPRSHWRASRRSSDYSSSMSTHAKEALLGVQSLALDYLLIEVETTALVATETDLAERAI